jgi:hypothetical protein
MGRAGVFSGGMDTVARGTSDRPQKMRPNQESKAGAWRIARDVQWRVWDGEVVAYSDTTGDTHHFADIAAFVFRILADNAASEPDIRDLAAREIELPAAIDRDTALRRTLALFERLALIEAA